MVHLHRFILPALVWALSPGCGGQENPFRSARIVDVQGSATRVLTLGLEERQSGEPVFVLFSGGGSPLTAWGDWISRISSVAPVVSYDRPGIGESPFDGIDPTPTRVVEHAHALLTVLDVPPPYILVGHSWGGPLIRFYAGAHPAGILGMVYLDPTDMEATAAEAMVASNEEELQQRQAELDEIRSRRDLSEGRQAEIRATSAFLRTPPAERGLPDDLDVPALMILGTLIPGIASDAPSYVDQSWFEGLYAGRIERFTQWSKDGPERTLLVWPDAGHFVHRDEPERTLEAVRRLVEHVSGRR